MSRRITLVALVTLVAPLARADRKGQATHRTTRDLASFASALGEMKAGKWDPGRPAPDPAKCQEAIDWARSHGLEGADVLFDYAFEHAPDARPSGSGVSELRLDQAPALCAAYAETVGPFRLQYEAGHALEPFAEALSWMGNVAPGEGGNDAVKQLETRGAECRSAVDKAVAAGARLDGKVVVRDLELTLERARQEVCDRLAERVPEYIARHREVVRAKREKTMAPYRAAGIAGQKLELMIEYDGVYWRGAGGGIVSDPAALARARVLFHWLEAPDGTHVVRRYQFSGNRLVLRTEKTFRRAPGSDAFR